MWSNQTSTCKAAGYPHRQAVGAGTRASWTPPGGPYAVLKAEAVGIGAKTPLSGFPEIPGASRTAYSTQALATMSVTHLDLEVLARCGDQRAATQPQHDQDGEEETAEQGPSRQPRAPVPRAGTAQPSEPQVVVPSPAKPTGTHRDTQLRKSLSCWSSDAALALLVFTRVLALLTLSKGSTGSQR